MAAAGRSLMMPAITHLVKTLKRMSVVFIVSDFMTDDDVLESRELALLAARHDVIAVVPRIRPSARCRAGGGYLRVRDIESGREVAVGLSDRARRGYAAAARERREALTRAFYRVPMDHVFVPTDAARRAGAVAVCQEDESVKRVSFVVDGAVALCGRRRGWPPRRRPPAARRASGAARPQRASQVRRVDRTAVWVGGPRHLHGRRRSASRASTSCDDDLAKEQLKLNGLEVCRPRLRTQDTVRRRDGCTGSATC